jgi:hypothetical protein
MATKFKYIIASLVVLVFICCDQKSSQKKTDFEFDADTDIKNGEVHLISYGLKFPPPPGVPNISKQIDSLNAKYGVVWKNHGCSPPSDTSALHEYNNKVIEYLSIRNGKGWFTKYEKSVDSLYNSAK